MAIRVFPWRRPWSRGLLISAALCGAGCDSATQVEGRVSWASADGVYGIQYLTPPWEADLDEAQELRLRIRAEIFGASLDGTPPTHVFALARVDGPFDVESLIPPELRDPVDAATGNLPEIPEGVDPSDYEGELPPGFEDVSLDNPREVALTELNALITVQRADLVLELAEYPKAQVAGVISHEVIVRPGIFVRSFYFPTEGNVVRAVFASSFDLNDDDIDTMVATIGIARAGEGG